MVLILGIYFIRTYEKGERAKLRLQHFFLYVYGIRLDGSECEESRPIQAMRAKS